MIADVLVLGGGPAGRALALECGRRGLRTTLLDRTPDAPWRNTYGAWDLDLPPDLPAHTVAARARGRAIAHTGWELGRDYSVFDVPALRAHLDAGLNSAGVEVRAGRGIALAAAADVSHASAAADISHIGAAADISHIGAAADVSRAGAAADISHIGEAADVSRAGGVELADGSRLAATLVVDAGGHRQPLRRPHPTGPAAEQTAYGVVVPESAAAPLIAAGEALFMDWRPDHAEPGWPTFLYAIPLGGGAVLLEETSLARRPGLPMPVLRRRLHARLRHHGIAVPPGAAVERVHFPVDSPRHRTPGVLGFGAAAPLVHPASGFSIAAALTLAPVIADVLVARWSRGPDAALAAARAAVWSPRAVAVHRLRRIGLEALLRMPPAEVAGFFEVFFSLPERHRWAYLSGRDDLAGIAATMAALFTRSDWTLRYRLVGPALRPPAPPVRPGSPERGAARVRPR